eukprot:3793131-Rhodomonas_salina.1
MRKTAKRKRQSEIGQGCAVLWRALDLCPCDPCPYASSARSSPRVSSLWAESTSCGVQRTGSRRSMPDAQKQISKRQTQI